jgi:hypothetical protein
MLIALLFWAGSIAFCVAASLICCKQIEASGVRRWGACGNLFFYE